MMSLLVRSLLVCSTKAFIVTPPASSCHRIIHTAQTNWAPQGHTTSNSAVAPLNLSGGVFGGGDAASQMKDKELASYKKVGPVSKYNALVEYLRLWTEQVQGSGKLTTPAQVVIHDALPDDGVDSSVSIKFLFQTVDTKYKSKKEEDASESGDNNAGEKKEAKPGGVEILVEKTSGSQLDVVVQRCDTDEDTVIKEMSEETIVKELNKAIDVWKKEQK